MDDLIERMRSLEQDHEPEGWPAVQMRDISALCDALEATHTQRAPKGWKLVPVEPTPDMLISAQQVIYSYDLRVIFGAMLDAAPQPPAEQGPPAMTDLKPCWKCGSPGVIDENGGYQYAVCTNTRGCSNSGNWGIEVADWNRGGLTEFQELRQQLKQLKAANRDLQAWLDDVRAEAERVQKVTSVINECLRQIKSSAGNSPQSHNMQWISKRCDFALQQSQMPE